MIELEAGHTYTVGTFTGTQDFADDSAIFEHAAQFCMGYVEFAGEAGGYCIITAANSDRLFLKWTCGPTDLVPAGATAALACTSMIVGGTGGFVGATGIAESIGVSTVTHVDGTTSAYDIYSGFDLVLAD